MSSTETTQLRFEKQGIGENDNTWGTKLNTNFDLIEDAIAGYTTVALGGASYTLSTAQFAVDEARMAFMELTGTLVSNVGVVVPAVPKEYVVRNRTTGGFTVTFRQAGATGFVVPQGTNAHLITDGATVVAAGFPMSADLGDIDTKIQAVGDVRYPRLSATGTFTAPVYLTSAALNEAKSFNITAAATIDLAGASGNFVDVSGETQIVSFGSAVAGTRRELRAVTTVNLANNNNSQILQGRENVVLVSGDWARAFSLGGSSWVVPAIERRVKPRFSARLNNGTACAPGSFTKAEFGTEEFDNNDNYSTASYRFTPTVPGKYQVNALITIGAINGEKPYGIAIYKNSAIQKQNLLTSPNLIVEGYADISELIDMNGTGDFIEIYVYNGDSFSQSLTTQAEKSHFSAFLVE